MDIYNIKYGYIIFIGYKVLLKISKLSTKFNIYLL